MFSFLRRTSAADIAASLFPSLANDEGEEAEVEGLLQVAPPERMRGKRTRSVTFEFEIKTEDEDEASLSTGNGHDSDHSSSRVGPHTPQHEVIVFVPTLTPEERAAWTSRSPLKRKADETDGGSLSPLKIHAVENASKRVSRARKARPAAATQREPAAAKERAPRKVSARSKVKVEAADEVEDAPRRKRRKVEKVDESSEVEEVAPPPTRVSRSRKAAANANPEPTAPRPHVDEIVAPARSTRRRTTVKEEEEGLDLMDTIVVQRKSPRKRTQVS